MRSDELVKYYERFKKEIGRDDVVQSHFSEAFYKYTEKYTSNADAVYSLFVEWYKRIEMVYPSYEALLDKLLFNAVEYNVGSRYIFILKLSHGKIKVENNLVGDSINSLQKALEELKVALEENFTYC